MGKPSKAMTFDDIAKEWERETYFMGRNFIIVVLFLAVVQGPSEMLLQFFVQTLMWTIQPVLLFQ